MREPSKSGRLGLVQELLLWAPALMAFCLLCDKASWFWVNVPEMQFGWAIPLLGGYLIWERWLDRGVRVEKWGVASVGLMFLGCASIFVTQIYQAAYGLTAASMSGVGLGFLLIGLANASYIHGFAGIRQFWFGFAFLLLAIPIPSIIYERIVGTLQNSVAWMTVELLALYGIPAQLQGSLVQLPSCTVGVNEACSGIRSLQSTLMASLFIGSLTLKWWFAQIALLVFGLLLAIIGNLVRVFYLSVSASREGVEVLDSVHDTAGWSILLFTIVGVVLLSWILGKIEQWVITVSPGVVGLKSPVGGDVQGKRV
ncbi:MAG: hypothetical protein M2R45_01828 [Verrucomicrobia subdivision 3 bacterium]|nr:hypothetical protein [Limisphaerales bacterium]MCS1415817.1 hypothetical protein [Limisphaerales bacterium]